MMSKVLWFLQIKETILEYSDIKQWDLIDILFNLAPLQCTPKCEEN